MRLLALLVLAAAFSFADDKLPVFRLSVELVETADAQTSSAQTTRRGYDMLSESNSRAKINASVRVPYFSGPPEQPQVHTFAIGSIVECTPRDLDRGVHVNCSIESSYLAPPRAGQANGLPPQFHSRQMQASAQIPLAERVLLTAFDDPASQHHIDVYITVRKVSP